MGVSWRKNLYIIWTAQLIAMIGMSMVIPFLPLYVKDLGITEISEVKRWSGLVVSGVFITAFIATPVWGWLGDRIGRKKMVLRAVFGLAVSQCLIGLSQDVVQLFIFRMVQGALSGFIASALALVSSNTPKERSGYAIGFLASSTAAGNLLGPFIGGLLADTFGYRNVFFITSVMCAISGILIFLFVKEFNKPIYKKSDIRENYILIFNNNRLKYALLLLVISAASNSMIQPLFALFIERKLTQTEYLATITGSIFGVVGLFQVISSSIWGKLNDRLEIRKNLAWAMIGAGAGYALHIVSTGIWELVPIRALLGLCLGGVMPSLFSFINKCIPDNRKGGIMGIASSFTMLGNLIGPVTSGYISSVTSIDFIFILSGVILISGSVLAFSKLKETPKEHHKIRQKDKAMVKEEIAAGTLNN